MKTLGERIRELREERDLSGRELAKRLSLSAAFLSDVELGRRYPSPEVLVHIARVLGTAVADLRQYDTRPRVAELKRLAASNPAYGVLFRKVAEANVDPEALIAFLDRQTAGIKKK